MAADPAVTATEPLTRGTTPFESSSSRVPRAIPAAVPRGWELADRLTCGLAIGAPALLTVYLGYNNGGYFPLPPALGGAGLAVVLGLRVLCARRTGTRPTAGWLVLVGALGLLAAWTLLSSSWSHSSGRALIAYDRTLLYGLAAAVAGSVAYTPSRSRAAVYVVLGAMVAVCVGALVSQTLPGLWPTTRALYTSRLSYPLNYPNALGILAAVATVLAFHVACCTSGSRAARIAAAVVTPLCAVALYMTLSRGAAWSALLALLVYVTVARPGALVAGIIATGPATAVALIATYLIGYRAPIPSGSLVPHGAVIVAIVVAAMLVAGALRSVLPERRFERLAIKLPVLIGGRRVAPVGLLAVLVVVGTAVYVDRLAHESASQTSAPVLGTGADRLTSVSPDGRISFWKVALKDFREQPLHGLGAGMYAVSWAASTDGDTTHQDAQSLYLQTLGELGVVGLALLLVALGALAVGLVRRARGGDRAIFVALLAAGLAWAVSAAVDWDWEMPAVTLWLFALGGLALGATASPGRRTRGAMWPIRSSSRGRWTLRVVGAAACVGLAVTPAAMALSEYRLERSIHALATSCPEASNLARSSLAAIGSRAEPYQIIGFCDLGAGRPGAALREMRAGLSHDPHNWQLQYGVAVALAATGRDPRREIVIADREAPMDLLVIREATAMLSHEQTSLGWRRLAAEAWVPLPLVPLAPNNGPQFQEGTFPGAVVSTLAPL